VEAQVTEIDPGDCLALDEFIHPSTRIEQHKARHYLNPDKRLEASLKNLDRKESNHCDKSWYGEIEEKYNIVNRIHKNNVFSLSK